MKLGISGYTERLDPEAIKRAKQEEEAANEETEEISPGPKSGVRLKAHQAKPSDWVDVDLSELEEDEPTPPESAAPAKSSTETIKIQLPKIVREALGRAKKTGK